MKKLLPLILILTACEVPTAIGRTILDAPSAIGQVLTSDKALATQPTVGQALPGASYCYDEPPVEPTRKCANTMVPHDVFVYVKAVGNPAEVHVGGEPIQLAATVFNECRTAINIPVSWYVAYQGPDGTPSTARAEWVNTEGLLKGVSGDGQNVWVSAKAGDAVGWLRIKVLK